MKTKRRYGIVDGERVLIRRNLGCDGYEVKFTDSCSGCFESEDGHPCGDYPRHPKHGCYIGAGCEECGHRGVRVRREWVPMDYDMAKLQRRLDSDYRKAARA